MLTGSNPPDKTPAADEAKDFRDRAVSLTSQALKAAADAFLASLARQPDDDLADFFGDWLDAQGPTPVRLGHLPNWLRLGWLRAVRPSPRPRAQGRHLNGGSVAMEIDAWLAGHRLLALDHWGATVVAGRPCLVTEPYSTLPEVLRQCRALALVVGGIAAAARRSEWAHGTVRGPPSTDPTRLTMPDPRSPESTPTTPILAALAAGLGDVCRADGLGGARRHRGRGSPGGRAPRSQGQPGRGREGNGQRQLTGRATGRW